MNQKTEQQELSINDLKCAVYDRMSEIEIYMQRVQVLQNEVQQINAQIQEKVKKEKEANAVV